MLSLSFRLRATFAARLSVLSLVCFAQAGIARAAEPPVQVTTRSVSAVVVTASKSAPAEVVPANRTTLAASVPGQIAKVLADVGAAVKKGDLLIQIDRRDYTLGLRRAEGNLASLGAQISRAETQLNNSEELAKRNYASEDELLALSTNLAVLRRNAEVQRVEVGIAKLNLRRTKVTAPFDGVIEARDAQEGGYVTVGGPLLTLTQTSQREISADLYPDLVASLETAETIRFENAGRSFAAEVLRISAVVDPKARTQTVRLKFQEAEAPVGSTGTIEWSASGGRIPTHLIVQRDGRLGVFLADGETARFHPLTDASEGRAASHDLSADTALIVEGRTRLQDGDRISAAAQ